MGAEPILKHGHITENETWSGQVHLIGDIIINKDTTVTIKPGTVLRFANYDIKNYGSDPNHTELIVKGKIDAQSPSSNPITIQSLHNTELRSLSVKDDHTILKFQPYLVNTDSMVNEFKSFKIQYFIFWSITYLMWVIRGG